MSYFTFHKISIVESLGDEKKTGRLLADDLAILEIKYGRSIPIEFVEISHKQDLISHLEDLIKDAQSSGLTPLLHIETHGSDDKSGLILSSGDYVSWAELEPLFRKLNIATKCNLMVVMAACFGAYANTTISILDRAPFWGVIGPVDGIYPEHLLRSLTRFYTSLYSGENSKKLLASLIYTSTESDLHLYTSEWFFVKSYKYYVKEFCTDNFLQSKVENLKKKYQDGFELPSDESIKSFFKLDGKEVFEMLLNAFFMVDVHPENKDKFTIKFEQIDI
ncbi:MAG: hypothetical protein OCD00_18465 [Colwellia sp.]